MLLERLVIVGILVFREILGSKNLPLCDAFPHLFFLSPIKRRHLLGDLWRLRNGVGSWSLSWQRLPFMWEVGLIDELLNSLECIKGDVSCG